MADSLRRRSSQLPSEAPPATGTVWCAAFLSRCTAALLHRSPAPLSSVCRNEAANTLGGAGSLKGKTLFIAGGSRGIGFCIAKTAAKDGANIVIGGKTAEPHPTLPGTIYTAAEECVALGAAGALGCIVDVRDEDSIEAAVGEAVAKFGGIDILINCASAIFPQATEDFNARRFNLMFEVGPRGSMLTAKHCIPHLKESAAKGNNPHILNLSPPIVTSGIGQANYMINKLGMTISAISLSEELADDGVAGNTLWPVGLVTTSALNHMMDNDPEAIVRCSSAPVCCPSTPRSRVVCGAGHDDAGRAHPAGAGGRGLRHPDLEQRGVHRQHVHRRAGS